jgi:moderate conductance mechanosensitive channel
VVTRSEDDSHGLIFACRYAEPRMFLLVAAQRTEGAWNWMKDEGLLIIAITSGAFFLTRVIGLIARFQARRIERLRATLDPLGHNPIGAYQGALVGAARWGLNFTIAIVGFVWVLLLLNLPASAVVPMVSVVGAGLGFGAQQIVGDVLAGIFIISERQFGVGDVVNVGPLVPVGWVEGRVEEVTLRVTKIRTFDGDLFTIANGQLRQTMNLSRDWSRVLITVPVSREADLDATIDQLNRIGAEIAADPEWAPLILEAPNVLGVDDIGAETYDLRFSGRTLAAQQWKVAREIRRRIAMEGAP